MTDGHNACYARAQEMLEHAERLAARHCPAEDIAGDLVIEYSLSWETALTFVRGHSERLMALRSRFRNTLREKLDQVARGEGEDCRSSYQLHALTKAAENYLGWKPTEDGKRQQRGGKPQLVKAS